MAPFVTQRRGREDPRKRGNKARMGKERIRRVGRLSVSKVCDVLLERNSSPDVISPRPLFTSLDAGAEIIFVPLRIGSETADSCLPPKHLDVAKKLKVFPSV